MIFSSARVVLRFVAFGEREGDFLVDVVQRFATSFEETFASRIWQIARPKYAERGIGARRYIIQSYSHDKSP